MEICCVLVIWRRRFAEKERLILSCYLIRPSFNKFKIAHTEFSLTPHPLSILRRGGLKGER
jgi:hypothetical protein